MTGSAGSGHDGHRFGRSDLVGVLCGNRLDRWVGRLGRGFVFFVEKDAPYRIIRWRFTTGESADLVASERVKYWELNRPGGEEALRTLGLEPRVPRFSPEE